MHEFITVFSNKLINSQFDLGVQFRLRATNETLDYIQKNMPDAIMFLSSEKFFEYLIPKTKKNGSFLEFGVWKGKSIKIISELVGKRSSKIVHGFDSFEGLPEDWLGFNDVKGKFNLHGKLPDVPKNVKLHKGWFHEILPKFLVENDESVSFLHIDADLYSSTICALNNTKDIIDEDTILVFDEFLMNDHWEEDEYKALEEFCNNFNFSYDVVAVSFYTKQIGVKLKKL